MHITILSNCVWWCSYWTGGLEELDLKICLGIQALPSLKSVNLSGRFLTCEMK